MEINNKVIELGPHTRMTVEEALESTKRMDLQDVLILGYDADGELVVRSSATTRKDALWLLQKAVQYTLGS